jgi:hypothetical protein
MIIPNVRASFGRDETELVIRALTERTRRSRRAWEDQVAEEGLDAILDRPETLSAVLESGSVSAVSPKLTFYVMVRHTLLESGLDNPEIADYVAALLVEFAVNGRAYRIASYDDAAYHYLVDLVAQMEEEPSERRRFLMRAHLGNYSLWLSGLFPDYVIARVHRHGAPGLTYFEELGATGYRLASECGMADQLDLASIYLEVADGFRLVRRALNRVSDRFLFPRAPSPVDRLLRQVIDDYLSN